MKIYLIILTVLSLIFQVGHSQTNISGGVFSNAIWTKANSPYIITDNVVVFAGVTLTIQPGVIVKFNNGKKLEIRESTLIANGTSLNPIIFTSNNPIPLKDSWDQILLNQSVKVQIKHCEFHYAHTALSGSSESLSVVSSFFTENILGMDASSNSYSRIDSCTFRKNDTGQIFPVGVSISNCSYVNNSTGLYSESKCNVVNCILDSNKVYGLLKHMGCDDTIRGNEIKFNGTGIAHDYSGCGGAIFIHDNKIENNSVGVLVQNSAKQIINLYNNSICSNASYNFQNLTIINVNASNNCWCSKDSSYIASTIYDAYDNINHGIVTYNPINISICPMILSNDDIEANPSKNYCIYPNPFKNQAILKFENSKKENRNITIVDVYGRSVREIYNITTDMIEIQRQELKAGIYFFKLLCDERIVTTGKFIIE